MFYSITPAVDMKILGSWGLWDTSPFLQRIRKIVLFFTRLFFLCLDALLYFFLGNCSKTQPHTHYYYLKLSLLFAHKWVTVMYVYMEKLIPFPASFSQHFFFLNYVFVQNATLVAFLRRIKRAPRPRQYDTPASCCLYSSSFNTFTQIFSGKTKNLI